MKKIIIAFLSIALVISLSFNIILIRKSKININSNEDNSNNKVTFPQELIGTWNATADRIVQILDDGTVYWMYISDSTPGEVYSGMIGIVDGNSFIFSKEYDIWKCTNGHYKHLSDIPESELKDVSILYNITMYGTNGFSAQNVNLSELPWSFVKQE
ncbi:hypothetical protein [Blautia sp.]|uniref:hypothetical protein n=1 Tax=Blautia sp. TaxID=1955243 RepID=UPI002A80B170|nr:hypothetical protein [Blautia sp.]MDY4403702.1 hypothetical protein [Blautia sp.]